MAELVDAGQAQPATRSIADLPAPTAGPALSDVLATMRDDERY